MFHYLYHAFYKILHVLELNTNYFILGDKEEGDNEGGEQPRRYPPRQPRQQNWYNSYRGNRRGGPPNRGDGGDYNVRSYLFKFL